MGCGHCWLGLAEKSESVGFKRAASSTAMFVCRSQGRLGKTQHTHTHTRIQKDQPNAINKAECLLQFVELGGSQAQHWHSAVQTE